MVQTLEEDNPEIDVWEEGEIRTHDATQISFFEPTEMNPANERSAQRSKQKHDVLMAKREALAAAQKAKEQEEAQRRLREQEAKKAKQLQEQKKKEAERKLREEEEQRKKMQGGLEYILDSLKNSKSDSHVGIRGIELSNVRLRLLAKSLEMNTSCQSIDLSRKSLTDEDGVALAQMLEKNTHLRVLTLEGNKLGLKAAKAFADALMVNTTLKTLNLESNNITFNGSEQSGVIDISNALRTNKSLLVLNLASNFITSQGGAGLTQGIRENDTLTMLDTSANELSVDHERQIAEKIGANREVLSQQRRMERWERGRCNEEDFESRQFDMKTDARRLELEAMEERTLQRREERLSQWSEDCIKAGSDEEALLLRLAEEAAERKAAAKGKKKKGKKK